MTSENREERNFGLLVGGILLLLGAWWTYRGKFGAAGPSLSVAGGVLVMLGAVAPALLRGPFKAWMAMAEMLSAVTTRVILFLVFFLVFLPVGSIRRLLGADPLRRRAPRTGSSWVPYPERVRDKRHYEKMF